MRPYHQWEHIKKGLQELPSPLTGHEKLWKRMAKRLGHNYHKGTHQLGAVIGGRRRYHHRPLTAWLLSNGKVLTLTTDEREAKVWNNLKGRRHPSMPRILDVFAIKLQGQPKPKLWGILHERIVWMRESDDWYRFIDSFFRWRAWQKGALRAAHPSDLEAFLRFVIDPERSDPKVVQRRRIEHVLPWQMTKERRKDIGVRRKEVYGGADLEGKIKWAKAALAFLHANKVRFRDLDPSNLAKTLKGGRVVITNLAESRSIPKKPGRLGSITAEAVLLATEAVVYAYRQNPQAVVGIFTALDNVLRAEAPDSPEPLQGAHPAIQTLLRIARFLERDAKALTEEFGHKAPSPETIQTLLGLVDSLEKSYKKTAQKLVHIR